MYALLRPLLFQLDAETAHHLTFALARNFGASGIKAVQSPPQLRRNVFGLEFPNPVGLAAGMDKDAELLPVWKKIGFGFAEIGTITPRPQQGNPRPRLFRLTKDKAIINRMGFNNKGMDAAACQLQQRPDNFIVGANIGKNKDTPNEKAADDYAACFDKLAGLADYFVVNVSSPNTPGLRELQNIEELRKIIEAVQNINQKQQSPRPILLKIAPDLSQTHCVDVAALAKETGLAGVVATNTTISRVGLNTPEKRIIEIGNGGLSGKPVRKMSNSFVKLLSDEGATVVGVGGVFNARDAEEKFKAGASLIQMYTGLVYRGPGIVAEILRSLAKNKAAIQ